MLVVHVHVHVHPQHVEAFKAATATNARASLREPGIARFDVLPQAGDGVRWIAELVSALRIPPLGAHGIAPADAPAIVAAAANASNIKANPLPLTAGELTDILVRAR